MPQQKYLGNWSELKDILLDFTGTRWSDEPGTLDLFPTDDEVLIASYDTPSYEGYAFVLFQKDGKLYEVHGSHCSCYGLEGQWSPEETTWEALAMRVKDKDWSIRSAFDTRDDEVLAALIAKYTGQEVGN